MDYNAFKRPFSMYQFPLVVCGQRERVMNRVANHPFVIMCLPNCLKTNMQQTLQM